MNRKVGKMPYKRKSRQNICKARHVKQVAEKIEIDSNDLLSTDHSNSTELKTRLAQWLSANNISNRAGNELLSLLGEQILDGSENGERYDNSPNYSLAELLSLMNQMMSKIDRQGAQLISLRNEISIIKGRVCGEAQKAKLTLPSAPKETLGDFEVFEDCLKEQKLFQNLVIELVERTEKTFDKFIRSSWRQIITDDVARRCSWRGTEKKMCVRSLRTTLAIRNAFKQKFGLEDADFDRVTQKYFQYAQERVARLEKADAKKIKM